MTVLVTGGMGYIGSHTCVELLQQGMDEAAADEYLQTEQGKALIEEAAAGMSDEQKAQIKEAGCQFASKKKAWYWHAGEWVRKIRKTFTMDEIRSLHGSEIIKASTVQRLAAAH